MRRRSKLLADALIASCAVGLLWGIAAFAHGAGDYYPSEWKRDKNVEWSFVADFPTGEFRDRVQEADDPWNDRNQSMTFEKVGEVSEYSPDSDNCPERSYQQNAMHWGSIDGSGDGNFNTYAVTFRCIFVADPTELFAFNVKYDKSEDWYKQSGDPPSSKLDALAVSVHEFGHGTGFSGPQNGHFEDSSNACQDSPKHTMCRTFPYGEKYWRSLEEHDKHTFENVY